MNWVTVIWSMSAAVALTLAAFHLLVWFQDRKAWANFFFTLLAVSVAVIAVCEVALMRAVTVAQSAQIHRWFHVPVFVAIVALIGFILFYFRSGTPWLAWTVIGLRAVVLILDFTTGVSFNFREITALVPVRFLGETISVPMGVPSPWARLGEGSALLLLVFALDASIRLWRRGDENERRRALIVGGSIVVLVLLSIVNALLVHTGALRAPYLLSLFFSLVVLAMSYDLSRDLMHAARIAQALRENTQSMDLATSATQLAVWRWNIDEDEIRVNPHGRQFYGIRRGEPVSLQGFLDTLHPDDRETTRHAITQSLANGGVFQAEYRVLLPDGSVHWIGARGQVELDGRKKPVCLRGVSGEITERKVAELEAAQHRAELAHLTRVTTLSALSGSLAHELNQPLGIILSNAQAAQRLLARVPPDLLEVADILTDIVAADQRAGEVIQRLRALLKRGDAELRPLSINSVITEVLNLTKADLIGRGVTVTRGLTADLPQIEGDRVQLQQVLLNLILNGADAMSNNSPGTRHLHIATSQHGEAIRVSVRDEGCGISEDAEQLFAPFFTTKAQGLGMGLAICRSIVTAHRGTLSARRHPERGSIFDLELPVMNGTSR